MSEAAVGASEAAQITTTLTLSVAAHVAESEPTDQPKLLLGLAVVSGFVLVILCAVCIRAATNKLGRVQRYSSLQKISNANSNEQDRANILADVYGESGRDEDDDDEEDLHGIGDEAALARAWEAIERAASSDEEDFLEEDNLGSHGGFLYPLADEESTMRRSDADDNLVRDVPAANGGTAADSSQGFTNGFRQNGSSHASHEHSDVDLLGI